MASVSVSVSVKCVLFYKLLYNPFFIGLDLGLGHGQCDWAISVSSKHEIFQIDLVSPL